MVVLQTMLVNFISYHTILGIVGTLGAYTDVAVPFPSGPPSAPNLIVLKQLSFLNFTPHMSSYFQLCTSAPWSMGTAHFADFTDILCR